MSLWRVSWSGIAMSWSEVGIIPNKNVGHRLEIFHAIGESQWKDRTPFIKSASSILLNVLPSSGDSEGKLIRTTVSRSGRFTS